MPSSINVEDFRQALARMPKRPLRKVLADKAEKEKRLKDQASNVLNEANVNIIANGPQSPRVCASIVTLKSTVQADVRHSLDSDVVSSKLTQRVQKRRFFRTLGKSESSQLQARNGHDSGSADIYGLDRDDDDLCSYGSRDATVAYETVVRTSSEKRSLATIPDEEPIEACDDDVEKPPPKAAQKKALKLKGFANPASEPKSRLQRRKGVAHRKRRATVNELVFVYGSLDDLPVSTGSDTAHDLVEDPISGSQESWDSDHVIHTPDLGRGQTSNSGEMDRLGDVRRKSPLKKLAKTPILDLSQFRMSVLRNGPARCMQRNGSGFDGYVLLRCLKNNRPRASTRIRKKKNVPYIGTLPLVSSKTLAAIATEPAARQLNRNALTPKSRGDMRLRTTLTRPQDREGMERNSLRIVQAPARQERRMRLSMPGSPPIITPRRRGKSPRDIAIQPSRLIESADEEISVDGARSGPFDRRKLFSVQKVSLKRRVTPDEEVYEQFARVTAPARARTISMSGEDAEDSGEDGSVGHVSDDTPEEDWSGEEGDHDSLVDTDDTIILVDIDEDEEDILSITEDHENSQVGSQILGWTQRYQNLPARDLPGGSPDRIECSQGSSNGNEPAAGYMQADETLEDIVFPNLIPAEQPGVFSARRRRRTSSLRVRLQPYYKPGTEPSQGLVAQPTQVELNENSTVMHSHRWSTIPETPERHLQSPATRNGKSLRSILRKPSFQFELASSIELNETEKETPIDVEQSQNPIPPSILAGYDYFQDAIGKLQQPEMLPVYTTTRRRYTTASSEIRDSQDTGLDYDGNDRRALSSTSVPSRFFRTATPTKLCQSTTMSLRELTRSTSMTPSLLIQRSRSMLAPFIPPFMRTAVAS